MNNGIRKQLLSLPNVHGVAYGFKMRGGVRTNEPAIIAYVTKKGGVESHEMVPRKLGSEITDVQEMPIFEAEAEDPGTYRPAPGGCSVGHKDITAGTLGCWVKMDGKFYILSNNHVLANSNLASIGDTIVQPGPYDGGKLPIAKLSSFVEIDFGGGGDDDPPVPPIPDDCPIADFFVKLLNSLAEMSNSSTRVQAFRPNAGPNLVDAALAEAVDPKQVDQSILQIGQPSKYVAVPYLGMNVMKRGRTTRLTKGVVTAIDATIQVSYGDQGVALFEDQIVIEEHNGGDFSRGGDSGSLIVTDPVADPTALLFAGGTDNMGRKVTIGCKITNVIEAFPGITF